MSKNYHKTAEVWSQTNCPGCTEAKRLLDNAGYSYKDYVIDLGMGYTKEDLIKKVPDARSVPQIFINGIHIGGLQELKKKLANDNYKNTNLV